MTGVPVSSFGFAVAAHPGNGDILWFAPAEADQRRIPVATAMALTRTVDGGKIFQVLRDGLPQQPRYDRGYRHDLAVDEDGVSLLMASTSGGLWDSPDAGETLQTVCRTLPPAYAIRFC